MLNSSSLKIFPFSHNQQKSCPIQILAWFTTTSFSGSKSKKKKKLSLLMLTRFIQPLTIRITCFSKVVQSGNIALKYIF